MEESKQEHTAQELKNTYGEEAEFRDGQEEAIQAVLNGKRLLVVQKTGWGKSLVYFLATRMNRKRTQAVTLIISPLLALMNNQIVSADKLGLLQFHTAFQNHHFLRCLQRRRRPFSR